MVGSTWFADRNWDRLRQHACAYVQIDQPACVGTTRWGTGSNVQLRRFHQSVEARHLGNMEHYWHRLPKGGDASLMGLGVPAMYGIGHYTEQELKETGLARLGWWHQSIECNMDKIAGPVEMPGHISLEAELNYNVEAACSLLDLTLIHI